MSIQISDTPNNTDTSIFDELMSVVNKHIEDQYHDNRTTGRDYANVHLGSMQAGLWLDNEMKRSETLRTSDPNYVYTPKYEANP